MDKLHYYAYNKMARKIYMYKLCDSVPHWATHYSEEIIPMGIILGQNQIEQLKPIEP